MKPGLIELPAAEYWSEAKVRLEARRRTLRQKYAQDQPGLWEELAHLDWLEEFVRACSEEPGAGKAEESTDAPWISVNDSYPDEHEQVWCVVSGKIQRARFEDYMFWSEREELLKGVTHWSRQDAEPRIHPGVEHETNI